MFFSDELKKKFRLTKYVKLTFSLFVLKQEMDSMLSEHVMALHAGKKRCSKPLINLRRKSKVCHWVINRLLIFNKLLSFLQCVWSSHCQASL